MHDHCGLVLRGQTRVHCSLVYSRTVAGRHVHRVKSQLPVCLLHHPPVTWVDNPPHPHPAPAPSPQRLSLPACFARVPTGLASDRCLPQRPTLRGLRSSFVNLWDFLLIVFLNRWYMLSPLMVFVFSPVPPWRIFLLTLLLFRNQSLQVKILSNL